MYARVMKVIIAAACVAIAFPLQAETRVACVGDSITWGGKKVRGKSFPTVLGKLLGDKYEVKNFGQSGRTMLRKGDKPYDTKAATDFKPDIVIIKLGTNDTKSRNWKNKADFVADCIAMIKHFQGLSSKPKVWLCRPVPAYPGNFGISGKVIEKEVLPLIDEAAAKADVEVIDLFTALSGKKDLFPDAVHPNVEGHLLIAEAVHSAITKKKR
jgi:lysophospholipase L1-like esterase